MYSMQADRNEHQRVEFTRSKTSYPVVFFFLKTLITLMTLNIL